MADQLGDPQRALISLQRSRIKGYLVTNKSAPPNERLRSAQGVNNFNDAINYHFYLFPLSLSLSSSPGFSFHLVISEEEGGSQKSSPSCHPFAIPMDADALSGGKRPLIKSPTISTFTPLPPPPPPLLIKEGGRGWKTEPSRRAPIQQMFLGEFTARRDI